MTEAYLSYKLTSWAFGSGELKRKENLTLTSYEEIFIS